MAVNEVVEQNLIMYHSEEKNSSVKVHVKGC